MQGPGRRRSFVDILERVTDGIHVSIVNRSESPPRRNDTTDDRHHPTRERSHHRKPRHRNR